MDTCLTRDGPTMMASVVYNLSRLADFSGRQSPALFLPYETFVTRLALFAGGAAFALAMLPSWDRFQQFAAEHPDRVNITEPGSYSISADDYTVVLLAELNRLIAIVAVIAAIAVLLLAGAVARRLHDCGQSAYWALVPLVFLAGGLVLMYRLLADLGIPLFIALMLNNLIYIASFLALKRQLTSPGMPGPNKFGDVEHAATQFGRRGPRS
jgi:uncharacterized membrane protein YhaH (DUF805 family)